MTAEQAQEFLNEQNQLRLDKFTAKVDELFKENGYGLIGIPYVDDDGRIRAQVRIVAV
jgi:hypothetical protein